MDIQHIGGHHCVTGSCHLIRTSGMTLMVDCGMAQGHDPSLPISEWPVPASDVDYLFVTHAHLDHIGRIPDLIANGFKGEILCTEPTRQMMIPMMRDAMKFTDIPRDKQNALIKKLDELSWGFEYQQTFDLKKGVRFQFGRAGHILGSCFIHMHTDSGSVVFSGDLGPEQTPILTDPDIPDPCDLLILESTYGDRNHEDRSQRVQRLGKVLTKAMEDGGNVYIPAFSLGRTQELIYELDRLFSDRQWVTRFPQLNPERKIPVFIDTPLGLEITTIYHRLSQFWDKEARDLLEKGDHPIDFDHLYVVKHHRAHLKLVEAPGPAIIIAGNGMCTGGRIVNHLKSGLPDPKNDVLFVGYHARGTLGRKLQQLENEPGARVAIQGESVPVNAPIHNLSGYSAHADQRGLIHWVTSMTEKPGAIRLVHGESRARKALAEELTKRGYHVQWR